MRSYGEFEFMELESQIRTQVIQFLRAHGIRVRMGVNNVTLCDDIFRHTGWELPHRKERNAYIRRFWSKYVRHNRPILTFQQIIPLPLAQPIQQLIAFASRRDFYETAEWRALRYDALMKHGAVCQCCGRSPPQVVLHVDHIKPKSLYPEICLTLENLQVLCEDCNLGKLARDQTDWRSDRTVPAKNNVIPMTVSLPTDTREDRIRKIDIHRTPRGGYTRKSAEQLGVPWPLQAGWRKKLIEGI